MPESEGEKASRAVCVCCACVYRESHQMSPAQPVICSVRQRDSAPQHRGLRLHGHVLRQKSAGGGEWACFRRPAAAPAHCERGRRATHKALVRGGMSAIHGGRTWYCIYLVYSSVCGKYCKQSLFTKAVDFQRAYVYSLRRMSLLGHRPCTYTCDRSSSFENWFIITNMKC